MKTLEEVKAHFKNVGYRHQDMPRIEGFLFGKGLFEGDEFEIEFMCGERDFYDFKDWFNGEKQTETPTDWSEFGFGDFIHVEEGLNVIALGDICEGKFVGTTKNGTYVYTLTSESRPCDEKEIEEVEEKLHEHGIVYCYATDVFVPLDKSEECENGKTYDCVDKLEVDAKDAVENIVAAIHANELDPHEKELVLGTLEALVILGHEYE